MRSRHEDLLTVLGRAAAMPRAIAGRFAIGWGRLVPESSRAVWIAGDDPWALTAAGGLVRWLHRALPQHRLLCTTNQLHLLARLRGLFPNDLILPEPFHNRPAVSSFWRAVNPELLIWIGVPERPNVALLRHLSRHPVPAAIIDIGVDGVTRLPEMCFTEAALQQALSFGARDEQALAALRRRGANASRTTVTGDLRLAHEPSAPAATRGYLLREAGLGTERRVILAEKITREEQDLVLDGFARVKQREPSVALLIEPASPADTTGLAAAVARRHLTFAVHGRTTPAPQVPDVVVFPDRDELSGFYPLADVTIAGGSFAAPGNAQQNPGGPAAVACPVILGSHIPAGADLARAFLAAGAAVQIGSMDLAHALESMLHREGRIVGARAQAFRARHANAETAVRAMLGPLLPPEGDPRPIRQEWRQPSRVERLAASPLARTALASCRRRGISSWDALRDRLGRPRTILCLGNGPSSEDPRLAALAHDVLFRVNSSWRHRPFLNQPDVVFVGDMDSVFLFPGTILGFRNIQWESYQLFRRLLTGRFRPAEFFTLDRLPLCVSPDDWWARPTNGAFMVLAAVMLQPPRLILGGIDLFAHPDGRYPGELVAPNAYAQVHDRNVDLKFLAACLSHYKGELIVVGDVLRQALSELDQPPVAARLSG